MNKTLGELETIARSVYSLLNDIRDSSEERCGATFDLPTSIEVDGCRFYFSDKTVVIVATENIGKEPIAIDSTLGIQGKPASPS